MFWDFLSFDQAAIRIFLQNIWFWFIKFVYWSFFLRKIEPPEEKSETEAVSEIIYLIFFIIQCDYPRHSFLHYVFSSALLLHQVLCLNIYTNFILVYILVKGKFQQPLRSFLIWQFVFGFFLIIFSFFIEIQLTYSTVSLRCMACWFDTLTCYKIITAMPLANTSILSHNYH